MNREILFKAKRIGNGEWVEGYLLKDDVTGKYFIHAKGNSVNESDKVNEEGCLHFVAFEVEENTICQYTGFTDTYCGDKVYENDIIKAHDMTAENYIIGWHEELGGFVICDIYQKRKMLDLVGDVINEMPCVEVVGNIFDNPELVGGTE